MVEWSDRFVGEGAGLRELAGTLRAGWRLVGACTLAALLLGILGLRLVPAEHAAGMVIGPTARTGVAAMGLRVPLSAGEGSSGLAEAGAGDEALSDFARFLELLGSPAVARRLMADPAVARRLFPERWDAATGRWSAPSGVLPLLKRLLLALAGREEWVEPDATAVAARLRRAVVVTPIGSGPMRRLIFRHPDRAFALDLLGRLVATADAYLRDEAARRSAAQVAYVRAKLTAVTVAEHRRALADLMAEQERILMLIEVDLPFAADPVEPPAAAALPDWPDPVMVLPAVLVGGLVLGVILATARTLRR